jgi:hypothetical protein
MRTASSGGRPGSSTRSTPRCGTPRCGASRLPRSRSTAVGSRTAGESHLACSTSRTSPARTSSRWSTVSTAWPPRRPTLQSPRRAACLTRSYRRSLRCKPRPPSCVAAPSPQIRTLPQLDRRCAGSAALTLPCSRRPRPHSAGSHQVRACVWRAPRIRRLRGASSCARPTRRWSGRRPAWTPTARSSRSTPRWSTRRISASSQELPPRQHPRHCIPATSSTRRLAPPRRLRVPDRLPSTAKPPRSYRPI